MFKQYKEKIKVLHVYRTYFPDPPGGLQEAIRQIAISTKNYNVETTIFTLSPSVDEKFTLIDSIPVYREKSWIAPASCDIGGFAAFKKFLTLSKKVDVINYHFPWPFSDLLFLSTRAKKPSVMTYHSDIVRQRWINYFYYPLMKNTLTSMDAIIATSPSYASTSKVLQDAQIKSRVTTIPLGISLKNKYSTGCFYEKFNIDPDSPFIFFIGALRYYKGLDYLLAAAKNTNCQIIIAGSGTQEEQLLQQKESLSLDNVKFLGKVSDDEKKFLFENCYAFILPSHLRSEAYGMVLIEASMYGKPMISCDIGTGTSFINSDQETGIVISPRNPEEIANAINYLLMNPFKAKAFGHRAKERYSKLFSSEIMGKKYSDLYQKVIKSQGDTI